MVCEHRAAASSYIPLPLQEVQKHLRAVLGAMNKVGLVPASSDSNNNQKETCCMLARSASTMPQCSNYFTDEWKGTNLKGTYAI